MQISKGILLVCFCTALLGCNSENLKPDNLMGALGLSTKDRTEDLQQPLVNLIVEDYKGSESSPDYGKDLLEIRKAGRTQANLPALENYANKVLKRLIAAWPGEKVEAKVFLTAENDFSAETLGNHAILLNVGTFKSGLDSEDQLAAILAHELSHILADHNRKDLLNKGTAKLAEGLELYLAIQHNKGQDVMGEYAKTKLADWFTQHILFSAWNRSQENEADILGIDLLVKAGYQPKAMAKFLDTTAKTSQIKAEYVAKKWAHVKESPTGSKGSVSFSIDAETAIQNVATYFQDRYGDEYESIAERKANVNRYIKLYYRKDSRGLKYSKSVYKKTLAKSTIRNGLKRYEYAAKADESLMNKKVNQAVNYGSKSLGGEQLNDPYLRYLMFTARSHQGNAKKAMINLKKALASDKASLRMYSDISTRLIDQKAYKEALLYLDAADSMFDSPNKLLPDLILVNQKLGKKVTGYKLRCMASVNVELIKQCGNAEKI